MDTQTGVTMEEYLKKAVTEMLVLYLLSREDHYIGEIAELIRKMSRDTLHMVFPYAAVYRMETNGYIQLSGKRIAPDGRSRQYYRITPAGKQQLEEQIKTFHHVYFGVEQVLSSGGV